MNSPRFQDLQAIAQRPQPQQGGFSLVELMIALMLGLVVIGGLTQLYLGGRDANRIIDNTAYLNENGRFAMEFLARDLRMAGYFSCGGRIAQIANAVDISNGTTAQQFWMQLESGEKLPLGLEGFEENADLPNPLSTLGVKPDTDVFVIRYADVRNLLEVGPTTLDTATSKFTFGNAHYLNPGDLVVLNNSNCDQTVLFQITNAQDNDGSHYIGYSDNASVSPGNCTTSLAGSFECTDPSSADAIPESNYPGAVISKFVARAFYIADNPGNCEDIPADCDLLSQCPTLFTTGSETNSAIPVLRDVTNLQVEYGLDDNITAVDGKITTKGDGADGFYSADEISDDEWRQVVSFRLTITLANKECKTEAFSTTVALRNAGIIVGAY